MIKYDRLFPKYLCKLYRAVLVTDGLVAEGQTLFKKIAVNKGESLKFGTGT
jgi:hypothetical protein